MAEVIQIPVEVKGIGAIRSELKQLKGELANATDPADIERLSQAAGQLSDKLADANEKVRIFAAGSDFEKVSNGLGLIGSQLSNLDFEGAAESAKLLTSTIKGLSPESVAAGFKGLIATVGQLGNAFVQMGLKLLANPLFLLVAIVTAIVVAIVSLKDKLLIAQKAFDILAIPIKAVIQLLKDLTDWLGITQFAEEEAAEASLKASEKRAAASKKLQGDLEADYTRRIALAKAEGKDTTELEIQKTKVTQQESAKRVADKNKEIAKQRALLEGQTREEQKATKEKIDNLRKERDEDLKINKDAENQVKVIKADNAREAREEQDKQREKNLENQKRTNKERLAEEKRLRDEMNNLIRQRAEAAQALETKSYENILAARKANADALKSERQKEIDDTTSSYDAQIELARQFGQSTVELEAAKTRALSEIKTKYDEEQRLKDAEKYESDNAKALEQAENEALSFEERYALVAERERLLTENKNLTEEERTRIENENAAARKNIAEAEFNAKQAFLGATSQLLGLAADELGKSTVAGKALAVAAATIDTYAAIAGQLRAFSGIPIPGYAIAQAIATGAVGLIQVKKILSTKVPGKSGGATGSAPQISGGGAGSTPLTPNVNLFGQANTLNATQQGDVVARQAQPMIVRAVVSETEVTATQNRISRIQQSAEL